MWACFWIHFWIPLKNSSGHFFVVFGVREWVQKGEAIFLLVDLGRKSVFELESCISRSPKVTPRNDNRLKKGANVVENLFPSLAQQTA